MGAINLMECATHCFHLNLGLCIQFILVTLKQIQFSGRLHTIVETCEMPLGKKNCKNL